MRRTHLLHTFLVVLVVLVVSPSRLYAQSQNTVCMETYFGMPGIQKTILRHSISPTQSQVSSTYLQAGTGITPRGTRVTTAGAFQEGICNAQGVIIINDPRARYEGAVFPPPPYRKGLQWTFTVKPSGMVFRCSITDIGTFSIGKRIYPDAITVTCDSSNLKVTSVYLRPFGKVAETQYDGRGQIINKWVTDEVIVPER